VLTNWHNLFGFLVGKTGVFFLQSNYLRRKRSYAGIIFSIALIVLLGGEFSSFAFGAYYVYNNPISYVVAETTHSTSGTTLLVNATGLQNSTRRIVWIDPEVSVDSNQTAYINTDSGVKIGNVTANSNGDISASFSIDSSSLSRIESDGESVHEVWVVGLTSNYSGASPSYKGITSDTEQNYSALTRGAGVTFFVTLITFDVPISFNLGQLFLALWTIYLILFAMAMNGPMKNVLSAAKSSASKGVSAVFDNSMLAMLVVFPVVTWITIALSLLEQAGGVSTGNLPPADPLLQLVELSIAPLREELGFRVIPIGLAALVILFSAGKFRDGLLALWHPARYLKKNDSPEQYKRHLKTIYAAIILSAVLFGLAHVLLGAGWGPGKILSAAVAGIGLAGLYYLYGLPAAILLHWSIDYFLGLFGFSPSLQNLGAVITLYTLGLSVAGSIVLILLLVRKFRNRQLGFISVTGIGRK